MKKIAIWILLAITPLVMGACLFVGAANLAIQDWPTPLGHAILWLRASRIAAGFVVGGALACSGVVLQALLRNPLAEPYVLGVSGGSALGAALAIFFGAAGVFALSSSAFAAGILALAIVYLLAHQSGVPSLYALLLSGVIISAICSSLLMLIISIAPAEGLHSITWWMLGNLQVTSLPLLTVSTALVLAADAAAVIICEVPFGPGNLVNLEIADQILRRGGRVLINDHHLENRDYSPNRQALAWIRRLMEAGATPWRQINQALGALTNWRP